MELLVTNIGQLATMENLGPRRGAALDNLPTLAHAAVLVRDGLIVATGPCDEVESQATNPKVINAGARLATPGLVDAHTHLTFGGNRSDEFALRCAGTTYAEIARHGGGIQSTVRKTRACATNDLLRTAKRNLQRMLSSGTTTVEAKSGYGLNATCEIETLSVYQKLGDSVIPTFLGAHAFPPEFAANRSDYIQLLENLIPTIAERGLAKYFDAFVEERYFDAEAVRKLAHQAQKAGLKLRLHVDQLRNAEGAQLAAELGAITADHLEQTSPEGIAALAATWNLGEGTYPVLLPASVFGIQSTKYPDARAMIEAGLPIVLATDFNPGSSPTWSLPFVMTLACLQMRMTPAESLWACTLNAAHSLGLGQERGSLEPGKRADLVIWDCEDYQELPYWMAGLRPTHVIQHGQVRELISTFRA